MILKILLLFSVIHGVGDLIRVVAVDDTGEERTHEVTVPKGKTLKQVHVEKDGTVRMRLVDKKAKDSKPLQIKLPAIVINNSNRNVNKL